MWKRPLRTLLALILATAPASAMEFSVESDDGEMWILGRGEIEKGDDAALVAAYLNSGKAPVLVLESTGGSVNSSIAVGRVARSLGLITIVEGECVSACFFAFIGGAERSVDAAATLGLHQFSGGVDTADPNFAQAVAQALTAQIYAYVIEMGVDPSALTEAMMTPPKAMHEFSPYAMAKWKIVTDVAVADVCPFPAGTEVKDPMGLYPGC